MSKDQQTPENINAPTSRPWLENLKSKLDSSAESVIQIYFGTNKIYEQVGNRPPVVDRLDSNLGRKFQQALENPAAFNDSIRIMVDSIKMYHAKDAKIVLGPSLSSAPNQTQTTPTQTISQDQPKQEFASSWNDIRALIAQNQNPELVTKTMFELIVNQGIKIQELERKLEAISQNKPLNTKVGQWLKGLQQSGKEILQELKKGEYKQIPQNVLQFLGNKLENQKQQIISSLERRLADITGNALNAGTRYLAERFGEDNGAGVKVLKGNSLTIVASAQHSGIYSKEGQQLVQDGQIISPVTSDQLSKIAQVSTEAQKLSQTEKQVAVKVLRA